MFSFYLVPDILSFEKMRQRLLERRSIRLARSPFQWERSIVHEMDTVPFLQRGHTIPQVHLRPKARPD